VVDLEEMKREIDVLVVAKGFYNSREDVLKKQASNTSAKKTTCYSSENANKKGNTQKLWGQEKQSKTRRKTLQNPARLIKNRAGLP